MDKYQEALERIKTIRLDGSETNYYCKFTCSQINFEQDQEILQQAIDKAIKYDEKENGKLVIKETIYDCYDDNDVSEDFEYESTTCPHCNEPLVDEVEGRNFKDLPYCPFCGNKIIWEEEDESK